MAGISWLAHVTHAAPFTGGVPTVLSQEAKIVFGPCDPGHKLVGSGPGGDRTDSYTGGNTSFNGFPFLASFVAEDSFLPRWLMKRGHRLVFSNGIMVLAVTRVHNAAGSLRRKRQQLGAVLRAGRLHGLHYGRVRHG